MAGLDELIKARDQKRAKTAQLVKQVRTHTVTPPKVTRPAGAIAQPIDKPSVLRATGESARNALYGVGAGFANTLRTRFAQNAQNEAEMLDIFNHYGGGREASIAQARSKQQQWENQIKASNANLLEKNQAWNKKYAALPAPVKWTANAVGQTAQMAPAITAGLLGGPLYAGAALGTQVHGNSVGQALGDGAALTQAVHYGQAEALKEMAVEKMFGFMPGFGKGMVNVNKVLANASRPAQIAARTTLGTIGEGVEEGVAQIATPFLQRATYAPNAPNATSGEVLDAAGQGMIGGLLLGGAGNLYQTRLIAKAAPEATAQEEADRIIHDQNAAKEQQTAQEPQMTTAQEMQTDPTSAGEDSTAQQVHVNHRQNITDADPSTLNDRAVRYINRASAKAGLRYRVVDGLSPDVAAYIEGDTIVYNAQTLDDPQAVRKATAHEVYHSLLGTDEHSRLMDIAVDYYGNEGRVSVEHLIAAKKDEYAEYGVELDDHAALDEIGAEFMEAVLSDERTANRILTEQPNLAQRILTYIRERLADFKAMRGMSEAEKRQYSMLRQAQALYEQGLKTRGRQGADGKRYQIIDGTGKNGESQSYVKADRQVISGEDPKQWGQQVKRYINEKIRQNQEVYLMADNGDVLAITRNTAGKAAFRNKVKNRQQYARPMTDQEYKAKLNAEGHIDELAVISIPDSWNEDAGNKHEKRGMAQQGWDYRTAYFEDFDGSFYEVRISVSRDGDIREIYNVGQLNKRKNTVSTVGSSVRKDGARASILLGRRINNTEDISVSDASITNGEPLSNGLFDNLTPGQRKKLLGDEQNRRYKINGRNFKEQQLAILQNSNPMQDNYHTGIRSAKDILSFQEAIEEDVFTPDYTAAMAQNALRKGMITVYSSYPITQGIFVTPSKMEAQSYAGGNKIYSRTVNLEQVAWIDSLEGQFADIGQRYSLSRAEGQKSRFEQLLEEYGAFPEGESPRTTSDARTPQQTDTDNRVNRFARNAMEAPNINDDIRQGMRDEMSDDIASGRFVYESISNKSLLDKANQTLIQKGYEAAVNEFRTLFTSGRRMNASDIALGERLITEASKRGDTETAIQLIADVATLGTEMGQAVQALRLLKRMTPEGRLMAMQRMTQRLNGIANDQKPKGKKKLAEQKAKNALDQEVDSIVEKAVQQTMENAKHKAKRSRRKKQQDHGDNGSTEQSQISPEERLARKIAQAAEHKTKANTAIAIDDIVAELYQLAKESPLPKREKKAKDPLAILREAIVHKSEYGEVWNKAKGILLEKYKDDAEAQKLLADYFDQGIIPAYSHQTLEKSIEVIADEMGLAVKMVLLKTVAPKVKRQNFLELSQSEQQAVIKELTAELVKKTGAQQEDASLLANQVITRFWNDIRNSQVNALRRICAQPGHYEIVLPEECVADILAQETSEGLDAAQERAIMALAEQMPATMADKINAWRYLAMLGNPRTHIRNVLGNAVFTPVRAVRNILSFTGEQLLPAGIERTKSLYIKPEYRKFAETDYEQAKDVLANGGKYNDMFTQIEQNKQIFNHKFLEILRKANTRALEWEDMLCKKPAYIRALAGYMQANHLSPEYLQSGSRKSVSDLAKAENYAMQEALTATYQEASTLAQTINSIERKSALARVAVGAVMPFKKTPINIVKRGVKYSPIGFFDTLLRGTYQLKTERITPAEYIDKLSSGLTGVSIAALGYFLTSLGLIAAGADDDDPKKKKTYERGLGAQNYAIVLPFGTYTIDWLAPAVMPLMVGAEMYNTKHKELDEDRSQLSQEIMSWSKILNPVLEMSMMQGLLDALQSFQSGSGQVSDIASAMATGYGGQFVPTLAGQAARTIDETKRSTYAPTNSPYTQGGERFGRQMMAKLPGASKLLEPQVDVWGREVKQPGGNMAARAVNNMLNPGLYKPNTETEADRKLTALYDKIGESKVLPSGIGKAIEYGDRRYPLKASKYTEMQKQVGNRQYADVQRLQRSVYTKELDDSQMGNVVANLYEYRAKEVKADYLRGKGVAYEDSGYWKAKEAEQSGVAPIDYFAVKQIFGGDYKDAKAKYDDMHYLEITPEEYLTTKQAFGSNSGYTYDQAKYNLVVCKALDMQPADYQTAIKDISKLKSDEDYSGKSINNSKKEKILAYVNGLNISTGAKRYLFYSYYPTEKTGVYNYINSLPLTTADKRALWNIKVNPQQTQYNRWIDGLTIGAQDKARLKQRPYAEKSADTRKYINSLPLTAQEKKLLWEQKIPS